MGLRSQTATYTTGPRGNLLHSRKKLAYHFSCFTLLVYVLSNTYRHTHRPPAPTAEACTPVQPHLTLVPSPAQAPAPKSFPLPPKTQARQACFHLLFLLCEPFFPPTPCTALIYTQLGVLVLPQTSFLRGVFPAHLTRVSTTLLSFTLLLGTVCYTDSPILNLQREDPGTRHGII